MKSNLTRSDSRENPREIKHTQITTHKSFKDETITLEEEQGVSNSEANRMRSYKWRK